MSSPIGRPVLACCFAFVLAVPPFPLLAEPYIAFREGYACSSCHVNRTGGGMRNEFGELFTQTDISPLMQEASEKAMDFSPEVGTSITLGADFMAVHEIFFPVDDQQDSKNSFDIPSGNLYLEAHLVPEVLSLYLDETVTPAGASSREAFLLLQSLPCSGYLKAGRMLLPYGIRVWDDETFTRQVTGFNYDNQDMGVEVGIQPRNLTLSMALSNGTQGGRDSDNDKQISSVGSVYLNNVVVGGSFSWNKSRGIKRLVFGPYGSVKLGALTLLGEVDWVQDSEESGDFEQDQFLFFTSLNYWHQHSVNFRVAFDFLNPYKDIEEDEKSRATLGVHAFLTPYLEASAFYRLRDSIPQDVQGNVNTFTLALHSFF